MAIINLRDYYPFYTSDCFMEVSEEVAEMFKEFDRKEAAYRLRTYRHKAYYSLDRDDGLEHEALFVALSPHELYTVFVKLSERTGSCHRWGQGWLHRNRRRTRILAFSHSPSVEAALQAVSRRRQ